MSALRGCSVVATVLAAPLAALLTFLSAPSAALAADEDDDPATEAAPPEPDLGAAPAREEVRSVRFAAKVGARASYRRIFSIPIYGAGPVVAVGARVASGRVGLYAVGQAFFGRTQAGLDVVMAGPGFEVELNQPGFSTVFGMDVGTGVIQRASGYAGTMSAFVIANHAGLAVDLFSLRRGPTFFAEGRVALEIWGGLEEFDESTAAVAPAAAIGARW